MITDKNVTKQQLTRLFEYLDKHGEHALVRNYNGKVSADLLGSVIGGWATSIQPLPAIIDRKWEHVLRARQRQFRGASKMNPAPRKRNVQVNSPNKAEIMPLIDDDNPNKPKIIWSVIWGAVGQRQGKDFSDLSAAKRWADNSFGRANVKVRPLAKKYRSFLKNGLKTQFGLHG